MKIILGSSSPRRREILRFFSLPFMQQSPDVDERQVIFDGSPERYVSTVAKEKAESLQKKFPDQVILTADTIVYCNNRIYHKPETESQAIKMLSDLSGSWHQVFTGVCVQKNALFYSQAEETKVLLHPLSEQQIRAYFQRFSFADKAGGYAIQEGGAIVVKKIEGCPYNVWGLPISTMRELLLKVGIDLWDYLKSTSI